MTSSAEVERRWPPVRFPALAIAAAVGIAVSAHTGWSELWWPWAVLGGLGVGLWRVVAARPACWLWCATCGAAALAAHEREPVAAPSDIIVDDREVDQLLGWVTGPMVPSRWGTGFVLDTGEDRIWVTGPNVAALPGDRVAVAGRVRAPRGYRNPGAPDRQQMMRERGADWEMRVGSVAIARSGHRASAWRLPARLARAANAIVAERGGDPAGNALIRAAVLGDRSRLDDELEAAWRAAGVYHALSVSGMHLAVVAWLWFAVIGRGWALLGLVGWAAPRRVAAAAVLPIALGYTLVTGAQVATVRALIVVAVLLVGELIERRARADDALGLAAVSVLVVRPSALWDPGFQLSFAAAATLLAAAARRDRGGSGWRHRVGRALATSWAVTWATAPITATHFHEIAIGSVIGNLVVAPLVELGAIPVGLVGVALSAAAPVAGGAVVDVAVAIAGITARLVAALATWSPGLVVPPPSAFELSAAAMLWLAWAGAGRVPGRWRATAAVAAMVALCGSWAWRRHERRVDHLLRVAFLDVGQGDAAVVELPGGEAWLIDAGGAPGTSGDDLRAAARPGESVARYLRARRIDRIAVAVVSHPHPDHYLGLLAIAGTVPIGEVWIAAEGGETPAGFAQVLTWLVASGTRVVHPPLGAQRRGDVVIRVLAPRYDPGDGERPLASADPVRSVNDNSLVVGFERAGRRVLFGGDLEAEGESLLAAGDVAADVIKVPHHGSATSSTPVLVAAAHPTYAVISLARGNRFGFPGRGVVERWRAGGARVYRTDEVGAITATIDAGGRLQISTFDPDPR